MLFNFKYFKEIYFAFGFLIIVIFVGTIGFMSLEGYGPIDAFYFTVITVSTVGFGEVFGELTTLGRLFTSFLIITSFGTFAYAVTSITRYLVSGQYRIYFKNYKVIKEVKKMEGHTIVCGYGRNGKQAVKTLIAYKRSFVVLEQSENIIEQLRLTNDIPFIEGDATQEENLIDAGIERAASIITTLPKDSDNLFVVLTARELKKEITIISRASENNSDRKLRIAGANNVIMPDKIGGAHMASLVVNPDVMEFLDHISVQGPNEINLEELSVSNLPEEIRNKTIKELDSRYHFGISIIGFKTAEGEYLINPSPDTQLIDGAKIFVLGTPEQIGRLNRTIKHDPA